MQSPTCSQMRVRSTQDAQRIFQAVHLGVRPMVTRRLDTEERRAITSGCVFVWEERSPSAEVVSGIQQVSGLERWTEARRWGPSRVRDEFLFYHEKDAEPLGEVEHRSAARTQSSSSSSPSTQRTPSTPRGMVPIVGPLIKQTYSVFVETSTGRRKWHLIAYFTQETVHDLLTVDDFPDLACIEVPPGIYRSARVAKGRGAHREDRALTPLKTGGGVHDPLVSRSSLMLQPLRPGQQSHYMHHFRLQNLAPLAYLQDIAPPRRHPLDEKALMSFFPRLA